MDTKEKKLSLTKLKNLVKLNEVFSPITFPEIQSMIEVPGFEENAYLISDDKGLNNYGPNSYMVSLEWLIDKKLI